MNKAQFSISRLLSENATLVLILIFVVGLALVNVQNHYDPEHKSQIFFLIGHLGVAFLIASVLGLTIEQFNRIRHERHRDDLVEALNTHRQETIEDLQKEVLRAVYQRTLPVPLIDSAEAEIFQAPFIRHNWRISFDLRRIPSGDAEKKGMVKISIEFSYDVENVSKTDRDLDIPVMIDMASACFDQSICGVKLLEIDGDRYDEAQIKNMNLCKDNPSICTFHVKKKLGPKKMVSVKIQYVQLQREESSEIWCTRIPATGVMVDAIVPTGDMDFTLISMHQNEPVKLSSSDILSRWELGPALFPGQGVALVWRPKVQAESFAKAGEPISPAGEMDLRQT